MQSAQFDAASHVLNRIGTTEIQFARSNSHLGITLVETWHWHPFFKRPCNAAMANGCPKHHAWEAFDICGEMRSDLKGIRMKAAGGVIRPSKLTFVLCCPILEPGRAMRAAWGMEVNRRPCVQ